MTQIPKETSIYMRPFSDHMIKHSEEEGQQIFQTALLEGNMKVLITQELLQTLRTVPHPKRTSQLRPELGRHDPKHSRYSLYQNPNI